MTLLETDKIKVKVGVTRAPRPVVLSIESGCFDFCEFLTADQACELADALLDAANAVTPTKEPGI